MILAAHVIFSAYGFWLPNDPRGSWSEFIRAWELLKHGNATKIDERRSVAARPHNPALRAAAKRDLMHEPVIFTGEQAAAISYGFADCVRRTGCILHACAILSDHTHLVVARHRYPIQQLANLLKGATTTSLRKYHLDPIPGASPWAHLFWKVWLDHPDDVRRSIDYVEKNPVKAGLRRQTWPFVIPYPRSF